MKRAWRTLNNQARFQGFQLKTLRQDLLAGLTVGLVAIPLSMALAVATGMRPENGLMTAIVAGFIASLRGGSSFNISGPTAAFVVVLVPIVKDYGPAGLYIAGGMAGIMLWTLGRFRWGNIIHWVPQPVVIGFTAGISVVIAGLQLPTFLGIQIPQQKHFADLIAQTFLHIQNIRFEELGLGLATLAILFLWPSGTAVHSKLAWIRHLAKIPPQLPGIVIACGGAWLLEYLSPSHALTTIGDLFKYLGPDGQWHPGVPAQIPQILLPWEALGPQSTPLVLNWSLITSLVPGAITIAALGALESLLCALIADRMTHTRHDPDQELKGQGYANLAVAFVGGVPATAAIARTVTNIQAGGQSKLAGMIHALVVLAAMLWASPALAALPMAGLAALLLRTAWTMGEWHHVWHVHKKSLQGDRLLLWTCLALTILFDMVVAVGVGLGLAVLFFVRNVVESAQIREIDLRSLGGEEGVPHSIGAFVLDGSLIFADARKLMDQLQNLHPELKILILEMRDVRQMDYSGVTALGQMLENWQMQGMTLILSHVQKQTRLALRQGGILQQKESVLLCKDLPSAYEKAIEIQYLNQEKKTFTPQQRH